ncbi:MAG: DUF2914 domain-containing protein [Parcubacteria group bacterium]
MQYVKEKYTRARDWYEHNEQKVSTGSILTGFVVDSLTLQRIDALRENLWILLNLTLVGTCIVLLNRTEEGGVDASEVKRHFWLWTILQFGFGALLGTFFIFYFRSATLATSWPFLLMLLLAMVANELFQKKVARLTFQISFYYLALLLFAVFLVPVVIKHIGPWTFILSGLVSLVALALFLKLLKSFAYESFRRSKQALKYTITAIYMGINILYFTNVIPPVPLSIKDAGVYHSLSRGAGNSYIVGVEDKSFFDHFRLRERFHQSGSKTVYAYSAIFSPASLNTSIIHEWQYQGADGEWRTASRIPLSVSGGRSDGFRTYSQKEGITAGLWRVNVATIRGQLIGRISFRVVETDTPPSIELKVKD